MHSNIQKAQPSESLGAHAGIESSARELAELEKAGPRTRSHQRQSQSQRKVLKQSAQLRGDRVADRNKRLARKEHGLR